jgi:hypothetical protein
VLNLSSVFEAHDAGGFSAMHAAEHLSMVFDAMAHDSTTAVIADRRQRMDSAFKAVKRVRFAGQRHLKSLIVIIPASITNWHVHPPLMQGMPLDLNWQPEDS